MAEVTVNAIKDVPRISSSDMVRRPGQLMNDVLRNDVVIVQNRGRDVAAVLDIEEYQRLLDLIRHLDENSNGSSNEDRLRPAELGA